MRSQVLIFSIALITFCSCNKKPSKALVGSNEGTLTHYEDFESEFIRSRNVDVWLPKSYDKNKQYQVLYMHDGQNIFNSATSYGGESWEVDKTIQKLIDEKRIEPTIVVGIWNTRDRTIEYTPNAVYNLLSDSFKQIMSHEKRITEEPRANNYLKFVVEELKPFIDEQFSTKKDVEHTFISGSSMGGLISLYALLQYPHVFNGAACVSTHWPLSLKQNHNDYRIAFESFIKTKASSIENKKLYFDYGTETLDAWYEPHQIAIDSIFNGSNITGLNYLSIKVEGAEHNEIWWRKRFERIAEYLLASN